MKKGFWILFLASALMADQSTVILPKLQGIAIVGADSQVPPSGECERKGVHSFGVTLLDANPYFLKDLEALYVGKPLTEGSMESVKNRIADFYQAKNQLCTCVVIPRQNFANEVLEVVVEEARLGEIRSRGNEHFTGTDLMNYIRTKPGHVIVQSEIFEDLAWMNQSPFRRTDAIFVPGKQPGTADLELITVDRWPYRVYGGADNSGTIATERNRLFFGFNFGKSILPDSQITGNPLPGIVLPPTMYKLSNSSNLFFGLNMSICVII